MRIATVPADRPAELRALDEVVVRRRARGGPGGTGVAVLCAYEAFTPDGGRDGTGDVLAFEVDASITFPADGPPIAAGDEKLIDAAWPLLDRGSGAPPPTEGPKAAGRPHTSLPREAYLAAVDRVKRHIVAGDIYQANLTQRLAAPFSDDPWRLYRALARATPAPRSAFLEVPGLALASVSPEVFVDVSRSGRAETRPIKGTRPRAATPADDARAAESLVGSEKDRAELVMIVDVLRNDLGRVAATGTVAVPEVAALRSYPAVHHLVARVTAQLARDLEFSRLLTALLPGGSITGAPKRRAVELLRTIEPCPRGAYTGTLFWIDDDGSLTSSILIRSAVVTQGHVSIGAGGGVVADSDAESEWLESNAKARALTRALGFDPEEAV